MKCILSHSESDAVIVTLIAQLGIPHTVEILRCSHEGILAN